MARRSRRYLAIAALALVAAVPRVARAQSIDLSSSMLARCTTVDCSVLEFVLTVPDQSTSTDMLVKSISLFSDDASVFSFASVEKIWNDVQTFYQSGAGNNLWGVGVSGTGVEVDASSLGNHALNPIHLTINMAATSTDLYGGLLTYDANGYVNGTAVSRNLFSTNGTVTPEPASLLLLGTGLAGMAGFLRRRRRTQDLEA